MIERIGETRAVSIATPSAGRGGARRQKRLKWLATLRAAQDEAAPLVDEIGAGGTDGVAVAEARARIADALNAVDEMRGRLGGGAEETSAQVAGGGTITAADLARRIGQSAERSLRVQARLSSATVRRLVDGAR